MRTPAQAARDRGRLAVEKVICYAGLSARTPGGSVLGGGGASRWGEGRRPSSREEGALAVSDKILVGKTAHEWFREMLADGLSHRRLEIQEVTEFYLVNLLAGFLERERLFVENEDGTVTAEPLALILLRALEGDRRTRVAGLRRLGDTALFVSGFFGDSLADTERGLDGLYGELAARFGQFVDLFAEIAELSDLRSNRGLVRLYERFLATRDARVGQLLCDRGLALFSGPDAPPRRGLLQ